MKKYLYMNADKFKSRRILVDALPMFDPEETDACSNVLSVWSRNRNQRRPITRPQILNIHMQNL